MTIPTDFFIIKKFGFVGCGRSDRIRTCGIDVPNVARYQLRHTPIFYFVFSFLQLSAALPVAVPNNYTKHTPKSQGGKMEKSVVGAVFYVLFYAFFLVFSSLPLFSSLFIRLFLSFYLFRRLF